jgi:hypothetical protein|nr:hypothetical protein [uncultured Acetatifactor sp.]
MDESILKLITEYAANERLDDIMLGDEEHMAIQKEVDENQERLDGMNLSKEQKMAVDDLTASYIALGVCHARLAYQQAFKDCAALLREIGVI